MSQISIFHAHTQYSVLDGYPTAEDNCREAKKLGYGMIGLSDHGNISAAIQMKEAGKEVGIPVAIGTELYVCHGASTLKDATNFYTHMVVWAKNQAGWNDLIKLVSKTNDETNFYYKPRISLEELAEFTKNGNLFGMSGHQGSHLSDNLFIDLIPGKKKELKAAYNGGVKTTDGFRPLLKQNWLEDTCRLADRLQSIFGKGNFFIELVDTLNKTDRLATWVHPLINECLRKVSDNTGIPRMPSSDSHYARKDQAIDHRHILCVNMRHTEKEIQQALSSEGDDEGVMTFFGSEEFYLHPIEDFKEKFTEEEMKQTMILANQVEQFKIGNTKPLIPVLKLPEVEILAGQEKYYEICKINEDKTIIKMCIEGATKKQPWNGEACRALNKHFTKKQYWDRVVEECKVFFDAGLSSYFLNVADICRAADHRPADNSFDWELNLKNGGKINPIPRGPGRGSAAGCLVSYLLDITSIDPLPFDLMFSRFYNAGRNTKDKISMPDIDLDFSAEGRQWIIDYMKWKHGVHNVAQIITFQKVKARAAIKDIFKVKDIPGGFDKANEICKFIPEEASIADEIGEMIDQGEDDYNIISWCLDHSDKILSYYDDPVLKKVFDQARRIEGAVRGSGKHPSGIIISPGRVDEYVPMVWDAKTKTKIVGFDFKDAEKLGLLKVDILGVAVLDKLAMIQKLVNGEIE